MTAVLPISAEPAALPQEEARPGRWRRMPAKAKAGAVLLGLFVLAMLPVLIVATVLFRAKSSKAYNEAREKISVVNADLAENVAGLRVTQAFQREDENRERFAGRSFAYRASRLRAQRYIALYVPFVQTLSTVASALVLVVAVGQVRSGALSVGARL